jgi:hypothetical protein
MSRRIRTSTRTAARKICIMIHAIVSREAARKPEQAGLASHHRDSTSFKAFRSKLSIAAILPKMFTTIRLVGDENCELETSDIPSKARTSNPYIDALFGTF